MSAHLATITQDTINTLDINDDGEQIWQNVRQNLMNSIKDTNALTWLSALTLITIDAGTVTLGAPTRFARDWIKNNLQKQILDSFKSVFPSVIVLDITVGRKKEAGKKNTAFKNSDDLLNQSTHFIDDSRPAFVDSKKDKQKNESSSSLPLLVSKSVDNPVDNSARASILTTDTDIEGDVFDEKYTFSNFIVGESNELAYAAARKIADGRTVTFNPLFFHGGVGLGKTHLMHAIALEMKEKNPHKRVIYLSAEQFMYRFVSALRNYDMQAFKQEFRNLDVLLIDDLQFISGKNSTQEEFFHTFNALVDSKKQIVISADRSPSDMGNMEERIRSRLSWGLVVDIHQTDYSLRVGIVKSKVALLQQEYPSFFVPDKVCEYLAHCITGNIRELEGAINRVAAHCAFTGRPVTMDSVEDVVSDLLRMYEKKIGISEIQKKVADYYEIKVEDMKSSRRNREVARPRQIAMYLTKTMTGLSFPEIGRKFGGKDHTTVLHAVRRIEEMIAEDNDIAEQVKQIKTYLKTS